MAGNGDGGEVRPERGCGGPAADRPPLEPEISWQRSVSRFGRGFDEAAAPIAILTPDLHVLRVNAALCELLGRPAGQLVGRSILAFEDGDDADHDVQPFVWTEAPNGWMHKRFVRLDGVFVETIMTTVLVEPPEEHAYIVAQLLDVTEQYRKARLNAAAAELGRRALESRDPSGVLEDAMLTVCERLEVQTCVATHRLASGEVRLVATSDGPSDYRVPAGESSQTSYTLRTGEPVLSNDLAAERRFCAPALQAGLRRALSVPVPEPSGMSHVITALRMPDAPPFTAADVPFMEAVASVLGGVLDRAASERELRRRAMEDPLTGLANRALLGSQLEEELRAAARVGDHVSVLSLDLDRFKMINDTLGHSIGDRLLRKIAVHLRACVNDEDLVARSGGDEFTIVARRPAGDRSVDAMAHGMLQAALKVLEIDGHEAFLTASVGIVTNEHPEQTAEELLRDAEAAMYRAKELGGGRFETFRPAIRNRLIERRALETDLRHALARDQLELHYQPVMRLADERVIGFEALLRWHHPERGPIAPDEFIPIAEETALIVPIGDWVLRQVCAQLARWPAQITLAANLSPVQITPQLVDRVHEELASRALAPQRLVLEITEQLVLDTRVRPILARLRELGVRLALDDFGTGYSSLGSLQRFPLDEIKLDRTLTASIVEPSGMAVARAAIELGHALGVDVIAEGIETTNHLEALRALNCAFGQGFLFSRPRPAAHAETLLEAQLPACDRSDEQAA